MTNEWEKRDCWLIDGEKLTCTALSFVEIRLEKKSEPCQPLAHHCTLGLPDSHIKEGLSTTFSYVLLASPPSISNFTSIYSTIKFWISLSSIMVVICLWVWLENNWKKTFKTWLARSESYFPQWSIALLCFVLLSSTSCMFNTIRVLPKWLVLRYNNDRATACQA